MGQALGIMLAALLTIVLVAAMVAVARVLLVLLVGTFVLLLVMAAFLLMPPTLMVSNNVMTVNEGTYDTRTLKRIEVFRVTPPPYTSGEYVIVFIFDREGRPRRVPLFVTGKDLKAIIMGIKPLLGHVRISIKVKHETPVKLVL